jgi:hypothetical protein
MKIPQPLRTAFVFSSSGLASFRVFLPLEFTVKPSLCHAPAPSHATDANSEYFGRFPLRKATEKAQFDNAALPRIQIGQSRQRLIEFDHLVFTLPHGHYALVETNLLMSTASLCGPMSAGVINQNASHHLGGYANEVRTILPFLIRLFYELDVGFVDQSRRRKGVFDAFIPAISLRHSVELGIEPFPQLSLGLRITLPELP